MECLEFSSTPQPGSQKQLKPYRLNALNQLGVNIQSDKLKFCPRIAPVRSMVKFLNNRKDVEIASTNKKMTSMVVLDLTLALPA